MLIEYDIIERNRITWLCSDATFFFFFSRCTKSLWIRILKNVFVPSSLPSLATSSSAVLPPSTKGDLNIAWVKIPTVLPYMQLRRDARRGESSPLSAEPGPAIWSFHSNSCSAKKMKQIQWSFVFYNLRHVHCEGMF